MASETSQAPKILLLGKLDHSKSQAAWESLSELGTLVKPTSDNPNDFLRECEQPDSRLDGVRAVYRTFTSVAMTGRIEGTVVTALSKLGVKFLAHNGAGYDQINIGDCTKAGIRVSNTPEVVDDATADTAIFLMLGALRRFQLPMTNLRKGQFRGEVAPPLGHDPRGKVLGILGMGGIGRNTASKARAFGMHVVYHNRTPLSDDLAAGAQYLAFDELLKQSDVISLNLPLNDATRHIISTREFAKMKTGVVIVNTARGPVMDEEALVQALESGKVFSAGLDVYEEEPRVHPALVANEDVILLPHMGTATFETQELMELQTIKNIRHALETRTLSTPVPEQRDM